MTVALNSQVKVLIVTRNGIDDTLECLKPLARENLAEECILIVDNASNDNTVDTIRKIHPRVEVEAPGTYIRKFPSYGKLSPAMLARMNFMHGSSMYRRTAFEEVGGYQAGDDKPEDHNLFLRIIGAGWRAVHCQEPLLEYRHHSENQANVQFNLGLEVAHLRRELIKSQRLAEQLRKELEQRDQFLHSRVSVARYFLFRVGVWATGHDATVRTWDGGTIRRTLHWFLRGKLKDNVSAAWRRVRREGVRGGIRRAMERFGPAGKDNSEQL